jgi:hypothetical protein
MSHLPLDKKWKFSIYDVVVLPGAVAALLEAGQSSMDFLTLHQQGNWGEALEVSDWQRNNEAFENGGPILSGYYLHNESLLFIYTPGDGARTVLFVEGEEPLTAA